LLTAKRLVIKTCHQTLKKVEMIPPERRHFAETAAQMLESGGTYEYVADSMRQMGFDAHQTAELLALAREIVARNQFNARSSAMAAPSKTQLSRKQIYLIAGLLVVGALIVGWLLISIQEIDAPVQRPPVVAPTSQR
jgi:hypothetical protein